MTKRSSFQSHYGTGEATCQAALNFDEILRISRVCLLKDDFITEKRHLLLHQAKSRIIFAFPLDELQKLPYNALSFPTEADGGAAATFGTT
jgi:hypothetical protein